MIRTAAEECRMSMQQNFVGSILFKVDKNGKLRDATLNSKAAKSLGLKEGSSFTIFATQPARLVKSIEDRDGLVTTVLDKERRLSCRNKVFAFINGKVISECESIFKKWDIVYRPHLVYHNMSVYDIVPDYNSVITIRRN